MLHTWCKTPSPCFYLASINRAELQPHSHTRHLRHKWDSHTRDLRPRMTHWLSRGCCSAIRAEKNLQSKNNPINSHDQNREIGKGQLLFKKSKLRTLNSPTREVASNITKWKTLYPTLEGLGWSSAKRYSKFSDVTRTLPQQTVLLVMKLTQPSRAQEESSSAT